MQDDFAVISGISHYPDPCLRNLDGPLNDAGRFFDWVTKPTGGDVPSAHVFPVNTDPAYSAPTPVDGKPGRYDLCAAFERVMDAVSAKPERRGRRLYIFLAGHGCTPSALYLNRAGALFTADAKLPERPHNLAGELVAEYFRDTGMFREVVVFLDHCRNKFSKAELSLPWPARSDARKAISGKLAIGHATRWGRSACEQPFPPSGNWYGVFSHSLIEILNSGRITGRVLQQSVPEHIRLSTGRKIQDVVFDGDLDQIVFSEAAQPPLTPVTISGSPSTGQVTLWGSAKGKRLQPLHRFSPGIQPWQGHLFPGRYMVESGQERHELTVLAAVPAALTL